MTSAANDNEPTKTCTTCDETKTLSEFYKHAGGKYGVESTCKPCCRARSKQWRADNPERLAETKAAYMAVNREKLRESERTKYWENPELERAKRKKYYHDNIDVERTKSREAARRRTDQKERRKAYYDKNREEILQKKADERLSNPEKHRAYARKAMKKKLATPQGRMESAMRNYVCKSLKTGAKGGRRTFSLLGYTSTDLQEHLEAQFTQGMTWENYGRGHGKWNIDHILPVSSFRYETPEDQDFIACWTLSNLRPMWAIDNIKKGAKIIVHVAANDNTPVRKAA